MTKHRSRFATPGRFQKTQAQVARHSRLAPKPSLPPEHLPQPEPVILRPPFRDVEVLRTPLARHRRPVHKRDELSHVSLVQRHGLGA